MGSLCYLAFRWIFELLVLLGRSRDRKEIEILVLRHELSVLRRQAGGPRYEPRDRVLLAALSRALPRGRWATFAVTPETGGSLRRPDGAVRRGAPFICQQAASMIAC